MRTEASSGLCGGVGTAKRWRSQQRACRFRNLCESNRRIQLINEYGTCQYIKHRGRLSVTLHQNVLTALEHWALRYQNSKSFEELEDERLLDEAIMRRGPSRVLLQRVIKRVK
jgi:hypothetical protein